VTTSWSADPPGARVSRASCRGCGQALWPAEGEWADADGSVVCFEGGRTGRAASAQPHRVPHLPMPAGLRGGPEAQA
jgi:hypothetical protein